MPDLTQQLIDAVERGGPIDLCGIRYVRQESQQIPTRAEAFASLAWLVSDEAWAPVDAALWGRCAGFMTAAERDRMNLEARRYLREYGAEVLSAST